MKKLLMVLVVLAIAGVSLGFYRGWWTVSAPASATGSNKVNVNLETDPDKMKEDVEKVKDKTTTFTGNVTDGAKDLGDKAKENSKSNESK